MRTTGQWQKVLAKLARGKHVRKVGRFLFGSLGGSLGRSLGPPTLPQARHLVATFPDREDLEYGAAVGLMVIQLYYTTPIKVKSSAVGVQSWSLDSYMAVAMFSSLQILLASSPGLGWREARMVARAARRVHRRDKQVWSPLVYLPG